LQPTEAAEAENLGEGSTIQGWQRPDPGDDPAHNHGLNGNRQSNDTGRGGHDCYNSASAPNQRARRQHDRRARSNADADPRRVAPMRAQCAGQHALDAAQNEYQAADTKGEYSIAVQ